MQLEVEVAGVDLIPTNGPELIDAIMACVAYAALQFDKERPTVFSLVIKITGTEEMVDLHQAYFCDSSVTDVITFPSGDKSDGYGSEHIGDIAICYDVAVEQAAEQGHSLLRELMFLSLHGLLHLLGFDDQTIEDRDSMLQLQEDLIDSYEKQLGTLVP